MITRIQSYVFQQRKYVPILLAGILIFVYISLAPSACYFYSYIPANEILSNIDIPPALAANPIGFERLPFCPLVPPNLDVVVGVSLVVDDNAQQSDLLLGGVWRPTTCISRHRVAIVVSYRNREAQLRIFLQHMHLFLRPQLLDYRIIVVEQTPELQFNRGLLFNIGFTEGLKLYPYHCFIFHDVDLLPENTMNMYTCSKNPRHMSSAVNTFRYSLLYSGLFGGAVSFNVNQFKTVNGFSNLFFGWGGEDDDISRRVQHHGLNISRWDPRVCRYFMLSHVKETPSASRYNILGDGPKRYATDGLSDLDYKLVQVDELATYTRVLVRLYPS